MRTAASWRMQAPCYNCPFTNSPEGRALRASLRGKRIDEITASLRRGEHFFCHETTQSEAWSEDGYGKYTPTGKEKICAGSIAWQARRGIKCDFLQIAERFDEIEKRRNKR